jgi:hypothetical protein
MIAAKRRWLPKGLAGVAVALSCAPLAGRAQPDEIAPFRLTGVEGNVSLRYLYDELKTGQRGGGTTREARPSFEEEVFILTHSYVYHPNFLKIDLGGGPLLVQSRLETDNGSNSSADTLYNLVGRLTFLEQKPYPFTLYYEHLNPSVSIGLVDRFLQSTNKVGGNFSLLPPVTPVSLNVDAFRLHSEGKGLDVSVDDTTDQATVRAYRSFGAGGYGQLVVNTTHTESRSGNPNLLIQTTTTDTESISLDSRHLFGSRNEYQLTNVVSYTTQDYAIAHTPYVGYHDFRLSPDLRVEHSANLHSFYRYNLFNSSQGAIDTTNHSVLAGLSRQWEPRLTAAGDVYGENNQTTGLESHLYGAAGSLSYRQPLPIGGLQLSYGMRYDYRDRMAEAREISVTGLSITLPPVNQSYLMEHDFIVASSIVVFHPSCPANVCVPDVDYRVTQIGAKTYLERLLPDTFPGGTSRIPDSNPTVTVNYNFQTGGTVAYTQFDQNVQANLTLYRYFNVFAGYRDAPQRPVSGTPTLPLNSVRNSYYGARMDLPVAEETTVGGEARYEEQREDIAPYTRDTYDTYIQFPLPYTTTANLRVSGRRVIADNIGSPEDVNLKGWGVRLQARPWYRATLSAETTQDEDTGGTILRRNRNATVAAEWRIRQLTLRAEGRQTKEEQGIYERERLVLRAIARREF